MEVQLNKYLVGPFLNQVRDNQADLLKGQKYTHRNKTYHVQMVETEFKGEAALVILAQSADRLFGDVHYADKTSKRIRNAHANTFPKMTSIIQATHKESSKDAVSYAGKMTDELQEVVDLFTKKPADPEQGGDPDPVTGWTRNQKVAALFIAAFVATGIGMGIRKGAISVPSRKAIADFMTQSKESFYAFIAKWRNTQTPPQTAKV